MPFPLSGDAEITINQTGGSRGTPHSEGGEKEQTPEFPEKRPRKKWTHEETQNLVKGCNKVCYFVIIQPRVLSFLQEPAYLRILTPVPTVC